jgi:hypothetical protein
LRVRISKHHRFRRRPGDHPLARIDLELAPALGGNACVAQIQADLGLLDIRRGPAEAILVQISCAALPLKVKNDPFRFATCTRHSISTMSPPMAISWAVILPSPRSSRSSGESVLQRILVPTPRWHRWNMIIRRSVQLQPGQRREQVE